MTTTEPIQRLITLLFALLLIFILYQTIVPKIKESFEKVDQVTLEDSFVREK